MKRDSGKELRTADAEMRLPISLVAVLEPRASDATSEARRSKPLTDCAAQHAGAKHQPLTDLATGRDSVEAELRRGF